MKAVIPIAGIGTRMRPQTLNHAKVLLPVAGKPMISYIIDELVNNSITDIIFIVGYLGEQIEEYIQKVYPDLDSKFVYQNEMLGLGHAVYMANEFVNQDELLIILGDTLFDVSFKDMISTRFSNLGVKTVNNPSRFGVAVTENDYITRLVEKPVEPISKLALVGLYYIKNGNLLMRCIEEIMEKKIKTKNEYQLTDALQIMIEKGEKFVPFMVDNWYDCGKKETFLSTNKIMLEKLRDNALEFQNNDSVKFIRPVFMGKNVQIRNCVIGPNVSIGNNTVVENSIIRHSIIGHDSHLTNCGLEHSFIGNFAVLKNLVKQVNLSDYTIVE